MKSTKKQTNKVNVDKNAKATAKVNTYVNNWSTCVSPPNEAHLATSYVTQKQEDASQDWLAL